MAFFPVQTNSPSVFAFPIVPHRAAVSIPSAKIAPPPRSAPPQKSCRPRSGRQFVQTVTRITDFPPPGCGPRRVRSRLAIAFVLRSPRSLSHQYSVMGSIERPVSFTCFMPNQRHRYRFLTYLLPTCGLYFARFLFAAKSLTLRALAKGLFGFVCNISSKIS